VQLFWLSLRNKAYALERVDKLYSVLGNVTVFWDLGLWLRNPILAALAIVTWYVLYPRILYIDWLLHGQ